MRRVSEVYQLTPILSTRADPELFAQDRLKLVSGKPCTPAGSHQAGMDGQVRALAA
jgi:hypothetical protein